MDSWISFALQNVVYLFVFAEDFVLDGKHEDIIIEWYRRLHVLVATTARVRVNGSKYETNARTCLFAHASTHAYRVRWI